MNRSTNTTRVYDAIMKCQLNVEIIRELSVNIIEKTFYVRSYFQVERKTNKVLLSPGYCAYK